MRSVLLGILACLGAGAVTSAAADPPVAPAESASTPASSAPAASTPAASAAAATTATKPQSSSLKDEFTPEENHFVQEGFHPEMRRGTKVFCRYEVTTGSRVDRQKICGTVLELKSAEEQAQAGAQQAARMQQNRQTN